MSPHIKRQRVTNAKVIKHNPPMPFKYSDTFKIFKLKASSPFMSSVKQISKRLQAIEKQTVLSNARNYGNNNIKDKHITVIGLQKVIPKLLQVLVYFQQRGHKVEVTTKTVRTLDEFQKVKSKTVKKKNDENVAGTAASGEGNSVDGGTVPLLGTKKYINDSSDEEGENENGDADDTIMQKRSVAGLEVKIHAKC